MSGLELHEVEVYYKQPFGAPPTRAVVGVSLAVERGQILGLVGESGCGKSTLARAAVGMVKINAGSINFEGRQVAPLSRRARPREFLPLQMVFQNPYSSLNPRRKVGTQLVDALRLRADDRRSLRTTRVGDLLERVGLPASAADRYPHQFSGGQRQRIAIARALAVEPSVIVLDEPLSSLDASAQAQIANLLKQLAREMGLGLLLISHDLAIVRHVADSVAVMYLGSIVERAPTRELWVEPLHPYSEALIRAVPRADGAGFLPIELAGDVPDPARPPSGCTFHPRCLYAFDRCSKETPPLEALSRDRSTACWLHLPASYVRPKDALAELRTGPRSIEETFS
jgi:peptide/nickel transport system ATP-binding protein